MAVDFDTLTDEDYFGHLKLMFQTDGWDIFVTELEDQAADINNVQDVRDERDLDYKRGQLAAIAVILNFEDRILRAEEEAEVDQIAESTEDV